MKIRFVPQRSDAQLAVSVAGDSVIVNGMNYDLSPLLEGQEITFGSFLAKRDGDLIVSIPLPYQVNPDIDPMQVYEVDVGDGSVDVPGHDATQPEAITEGVIEWPEPEPEPSQFERDQTRYQRRAAVKDSLLAYMAADNMSRVRDGTWTVADLTSLMADPALIAANSYMQTLSYELAAQAIMSATTPLLTPEIKADWVAKLTEHFYLENT